MGFALLLDHSWSRIGCVNEARVIWELAHKELAEVLFALQKPSPDLARIYRFIRQTENRPLSANILMRRSVNLSFFIHCESDGISSRLSVHIITVGVYHQLRFFIFYKQNKRYNLLYLSIFVSLKPTKMLTMLILYGIMHLEFEKRGDFMIIRDKYLEQIVPLINKNLIKVLTGVRRSGKTVLLSQIQDYLLSNGVDKSQIINISLESKKNKKLLDGDALYDYLLSTCEGISGKSYIFLDEIQAVSKWEEVVSSLLVDVDCDIYITGSNSKLLSGELATLIAGRYIQIPVYPFTLSEAKKMLVKNGKYISDESLFQNYLRYGGLPMRFSLEDISLDPYLSDTYDAIVIKDIVYRNNIKDTNLLNMILAFLMDNIANPFSARSIVSALKAEGINTTVETVISYIDYIKKAMIIYSAQRYDIKGKKLLTTNEKYYAVDLGLRNCVKASGEIDYNKLYENIVYLELLYRGYDVKVGKTDDYEIDFVAYKGNDIIYVQVCYLLGSKETTDREFGNLERIKDNYPKYVISGDLPDFSRNGIKHFNIIKFLLQQ